MKNRAELKVAINHLDEQILVNKDKYLTEIVKIILKALDSPS